MTFDHLNSLLSREIQFLIESIQENNLGGGGYDIRFGPDVEFCFIRSGNNIFEDPTDERPYNERQHETFDFIKRLGKILFDYGLLSNDQHVLIDAGMVEFCLKPKDALTLCDNYRKATAIVKETAKDMNAEAQYVSAHWHFSLSKDGQDLLRANPTQRDSFCSPLFKHLCANIIGLQSLFPAFFIRPEIAEMTEANRDNGLYENSYNGPQRLIYSQLDARASVRGGNTTETFRTVEPRLARLAPLLPTYMCLKAIAHSLTDNHIIAYNHPTACLTWDQSAWISGKFNKLCRDSDPKVLRGAGGYADMLKETEENLVIYDLIPGSIATEILKCVKEDYEVYLAQQKRLLTKDKILPQFQRRKNIM